MRRIVSVGAGAAVALGLGLGVAIPAHAASPSSTATSTNWHVGVYNPSGRALSESQASSSAGNLAAFQFTTAPNTALLTTSQSKNRSAVLGDITGKTVTATFTISGTGPFTYYGEPDACGGTTSNARLYFQTSNAGGFDETHYWWSNPASQALVADGNANTYTVTAQVNGADWSDYNGHFGTGTYSDGFDNSAANVTDIGLSFGGGCFFENGVGAPNATLQLNSFTVSS